MAETSGDLVAVVTSDGTVEARRMGRAEAGQSRWQVRYPWGVETFFGTSAEMTRHVQGRARKPARQAPERGDRSPEA